MIPPLCEDSFFFKFSPPSRRNKTESQKDTTGIAKLSVSLEPERAKIVDPRNTYGNPAQTYYGHWSRETTCKTVLYLFRVAVLLVHAPTIPNWVLPVAGPLYGVSKYFFTSRNPPGTYTENPPVPPSPRRSLFPHLASPHSPPPSLYPRRCFRTKGMRTCISKRPTEWNAQWNCRHTSRVSLEKQKTLSFSLARSGAPRVSRLRKGPFARRNATSPTCNNVCTLVGEIPLSLSSRLSSLLLSPSSFLRSATATPVPSPPRFLFISFEVGV